MGWKMVEQRCLGLAARSATAPARRVPRATTSRAYGSPGDMQRGAPGTPERGEATSAPQGHVCPLPLPLTFPKPDPTAPLSLFHISPAITALNWDL